MQREVDSLRRRANKHYRNYNRVKQAAKAAAKEAAYFKGLAELRGEKLKQKAEELEQAHAETKQANAEAKQLTKKLDGWLLFWGWVKAHCPGHVVRRLERLWRRGPRRAPDNCWGGGQ